MDSPLNVGDTTTNSIQHLLSDTHLNTSCSTTVNSAVYSDEKVIQLNLVIQTNEKEDGRKKEDDPIVILRRVQDSYINISQLFSILLKIGHLSEAQLTNFLNNEILTNTQYLSSGGSNPQFNDLRNHEVRDLRGLWIPYDRAVSLALKFDIYELAKSLFLIDVHDYDDLPKVVTANKRSLYEGSADGEKDAGLTGSPSKKQKIQADKMNGDQADIQSILKKTIQENKSFPRTLPPLASDEENSELESDIKLKFSEIFKKDNTSELSYTDIKSTFQNILQNKQENLRLLTDISLDQLGKTALHFASTLASLDLVSAFIKLGLCSPIRGTTSGRSPLISAILVTNSMERGNFAELLSALWPNLWLYDNKNWSFLHHLAFQASKNLESSKFYLRKILEWVIADSGKKQDSLTTLSRELINLQDEESGNTCLHLAAESESRWFVNIFLELNADVNLVNKTGVKPADFDIVKDILTERKNGAESKSGTEHDNYILELVRTSMEFHNKKLELGVNPESEDEDNTIKEEGSKPKKLASGSSSSNKIFQSIQDLLSNTNHEYDNIIKTKRLQINNLNQSLHDATIVTANNRFVTNKISEKLAYLDNLKLQMANISDKLQLAQKEIPADLKVENENENTKFDSDEPFIIKPIYERLIQGEAADSIKPTDEILSQLPPLPILKARIKAYQEINSKIESELTNLLDYSELTSKFKKVVSFCTGVDINEVDELLDGLLEAVEGQQ